VDYSFVITWKNFFILNHLVSTTWTMWFVLWIVYFFRIVQVTPCLWMSFKIFVCYSQKALTCGFLVKYVFLTNLSVYWSLHYVQIYQSIIIRLMKYLWVGHWLPASCDGLWSLEWFSSFKERRKRKNKTWVNKTQFKQAITSISLTILLVTSCITL